MGKLKRCHTAWLYVLLYYQILNDCSSMKQTMRGVSCLLAQVRVDRSCGHTCINIHYPSKSEIVFRRFLY